jgi:Na+-driven multidrug efflux pump
MVGQRLGAEDPDGAELAGWTSLQVGGVLLTLFGILLFVLAAPAAALFSNDPETIALSVRYLRILAVAQPLFMAAVVLAGALRAGGDTRYPMWISFYAGWVFLLPIAYFFAVTMDYGPGAAWLAQAGNYAISAILSVWRFRGGKWRTMDV